MCRKSAFDVCDGAHDLVLKRGNPEGERERERETEREIEREGERDRDTRERKR